MVNKYVARWLGGEPPRPLAVIDGHCPCCRKSVDTDPVERAVRQAHLRDSRAAAMRRIKKVRRDAA